MDQRGMQARLDKDGEPMEIRIIKAREIDDISEIAFRENDQSLLPHPLERKNTKNVLKQLKEF